MLELFGWINVKDSKPQKDTFLTILCVRMYFITPNFETENLLIAL